VVTNAAAISKTNNMFDADKYFRWPIKESYLHPGVISLNTAV